MHGHDREDIPGTRMTLEDVATRFNITFTLLMSCLGGSVFLMGLFRTGKSDWGAIPEPVLLVCLGTIAFALFFPWCISFYFARHLLHSVKELERKIDKLKHKDEVPTGLEDDEPWA
jgi:hypothetical protein